MNEDMTITILGEKVAVINEQIPIDNLKYLLANPRVHSALHSDVQKLPDDEEELQQIVHEKLMLEPSVKNLIPKIRKQGGLLEPIFVRHDTMEVIEGNSRLRAFHFLNQNDKTHSGKWNKIPCQVVSKLTPRQQFAYLNQIHVEGKTPWLAYEKANLAYNMKVKSGLTIEEIADTLTITPNEVKKRIRTIRLMEDNDDEELSHFSYYDVLVRNRRISEEFDDNEELQTKLLKLVREQGRSDDSEAQFKAQELRDKLPAVLNKKKELKKFIEGKVNLEEAYHNSKLSGPDHNIKIATEKVKDIEKSEVLVLSTQELNALKISLKQLVKATTRLEDMTAQALDKKRSS